MRGREGPGGTVVKTLNFSQKTWETLCVCWEGGLGRGRGPLPLQMTQTFSPSAPQDTLCLPLGLYTPPSLQSVCAEGPRGGKWEEAGAGGSLGWIPVQ